MRHKIIFLGCGLLLGALMLCGLDTVQSRQAAGKTIKVKLLLPQGEDRFQVATKVLVDGKEVEGSGEERSLTLTTAAGKDYLTITAIWEPNNYTKITRPRKVTAKEGVVVVDFRSPSTTEKDDIVVRYVPTPDDVVEAMCKMAKVGKEDVVYDLGCGDGRMVITAVKMFGAKKGVGIELLPDLVKECQEKAEKAGVDDRVTFRVGDVLKVDDLPEASASSCSTWATTSNARLKPLLQKNLQAGQPRGVAPLSDGRRLATRTNRDGQQHFGLPL